MCTGIKFVRCCLPVAVAALFSMTSAQEWTLSTGTATVPVKVNVAANVVLAPITGVSGTGTEGAVTADAEKEFSIGLTGGYILVGDAAKTSYLLSRRTNAGAQAKYSRGNITLNLPAQSYKSAAISLYSVNGKRVLNGSAAASKTQTFSISRSNVPAGVYLLSVKGANGNSFAARLTHSGGRLNINTAFASMDNTALNKSAAAGDYGQWTITVSAPGYHTTTRTIRPDAGQNPLETFELVQPAQTPKANFAETVGKVSFDMIYIPGGTFTIGCEEASGCPANSKAVEGVKVSNYYISKSPVTTDLWNAVMNVAPCVNNFAAGVFCPPTSGTYTNMTWFDAMEFACKLSAITGRNYRMTTEAEWEYAAKNHLKSLDSLKSTEEWAYNTWSATHSGGEDPVGNASGAYDQKTRRNAQTQGSNITARLIRSVEGKGPALRLAISADAEYPPNYVAPCYLHMPEMGAEPVNSYRDPRWVTGDDAQWEASGQMAEAGLSFNLRVWEDGTARMGSGYGQYTTFTNGQWFTSNNIAFVFVPSSGSSGITKLAYIFLNELEGSLIANSYTGRIAKKAASTYAKPTVSGLKSGEELAKAQTNFAAEFAMVDMENIPTSAKGQDPRLLDGPDTGWFQHNVGSAHHYRKDVDLDEFRFTVNQNNGRTMLANGTWFTVNNTFLRVTHKDGYSCDYLYLITSGGNFYHNSFMGYERGDFRSFTKTPNGHNNFKSCGADICIDEIPKGLAVSAYAPGGYMDNGHSTFVPAKCPAGGCK